MTSDTNRGEGVNGRPLDDTIGQTGAGIPDDAASDRYDPVADTELEHDRAPPSRDEVFPPG